MFKVRKPGKGKKLHRRVLHLLQDDVGIDHQVMVSSTGELECIWITFGIERATTPDIVSKVVLSDDLQHLALLGFFDEGPALQHARRLFSTRRTLAHAETGSTRPR